MTRLRVFLLFLGWDVGPLEGGERHFESVSLARTQTQTARSGMERTNHGITAPPHALIKFNFSIGHFVITSGLFLKASLGAHLFICKINFHSHENEFNLCVNKNCFP